MVQPAWVQRYCRQTTQVKGKFMTIKSTIDEALALTPDKVHSLFLSCEEIGSTAPGLATLSNAFHTVWNTATRLEERLAQAKSARGQTVQFGAEGTIWQRDRALLIALVKLEHVQTQLGQDLQKLAEADSEIRGRRPVFHPMDTDQAVLIANNLRCSYELHEAATVVYLEAGFLLSEIKPTAQSKARQAMEHLRHLEPGFNRNWVLKFRSADDDAPARYTLLGTESDTPPIGPQLSNWDLERAIDLVGASKFAKGEGWVAVYDSRRNHTGPKHFFRNGKRLKESEARSSIA
jgi:hypothetical protein